MEFGTAVVLKLLSPENVMDWGEGDNGGVWTDGIGQLTYLHVGIPHLTS